MDSKITLVTRDLMTKLYREVRFVYSEYDMSLGTLRFENVATSQLYKMKLLGYPSIADNVMYRLYNDTLTVYSDAKFKLSECTMKHCKVDDLDNYANSPFHKCPFLELDVSGIDTSGVKNMQTLFSKMQCKKLTGLDTWDTSSVVDMSYMFALSEELEKIDISNFDTSRVTNMQAMFQGVVGIIVGLDKIDTSRVEDMSYMFNKYNNHPYWAPKYGRVLDISHFETGSLSSCHYMFNGCVADKVDMSSIDFSKLIKYDGGLLIKDSCFYFMARSDINTVIMQRFNRFNDKGLGMLSDSRIGEIIYLRHCGNYDIKQ